MTRSTYRSTCALSSFLMLLIVLAGVRATPLAAQAGYEPKFETGECLGYVPEELNVSCGWLTVPENREQPNGKNVRLHVAIIKNTAGRDDLPALLYLEGGPGGAATLDLSGWIDFPALEGYDLITWDQRGTGFSEPSLNCPEMETAESEASTNGVEICRDRLLAEGVDLAAYNSAESAADVDDLRKVLNYEVWDLYGVSYGTRLALTVMRDYPQGVGVAILDAVYPPQVNSIEEEGINGLNAINAMLDACAADAACAGAFPDLKARFYDWLATLNAEPIEDETLGTVDAYTVYNMVFQLLYDSEAIKSLPLALDEAIAGNLSELASLSGGEEGSRRFQDTEGLDDSEGMNMSVECGEEMPFIDAAKAVAALEKAPEALRISLMEEAQDHFTWCAVWGVPEAHAIENEPVESDIPTLVLNGTFDPVTPPSWGKRAVEKIKNSYVFDFPGLGHGAFGTHPCPSQIAMAFLADPSVKPDGSCIADMKPEFYTQ